MLEVQHLTKRYGKTLAVDDVSFTVSTGRIGILLGPNGAGKSTVIKSIAGLLKYEGGIGINQIPSKSMEAKRIFAYVPEIPALFPMLNVAEHMEYIRRAYNPGTTEEEIQTILERFELDDKKEKLQKYAEFQDMMIAGEYSDEGKSGKNIDGRPQFVQMLKDIEAGKDNVDFVLVFKLSRFGRNAADVLSSLQRMQDFGVNLICVEDGIDSSKDSGKLMISVLSAVAEIERENILVQTMEGRRQKAREGKWNGGFAPYGYELVNGELQIAEDEAEIIRLYNRT